MILICEISRLRGDLKKKEKDGLTTKRFLNDQFCHQHIELTNLATNIISVRQVST